MVDPNAYEPGFDTPDPDPPNLGGMPQIAVIGSLLRRAEEKFPKNGSGRSFVVATMRISNAGSLPQFWQLVANSPEDKQALLAMAEGTLVCVRGGLSKNTWERRDGSVEETMRINLRRLNRVKVTLEDERGEDDRPTGDDGFEGRPFAPPDDDRAAF
jgi:hypothetical protein